MDDLAMLRLQMEWGADEALDDAPVDRLRAAIPAAMPSPRRAGSVAARVQEGSPVERAQRTAGQAESLTALKAAIAGFDGCPLRDMATNLVFAAGDADSGLLLIGGAPAADDDRAGVPFSGREGALLDQMLASIGLTRAALLLSPLIPWRPPGGRVPAPSEIQVCRPFLARLITLTAPHRIVLLGGQTAAAVLGVAPRARGIGWAEANVDGGIRQILILPALADVLKTPLRRKDAWTGMRALRKALHPLDRPD